MPERCLPAAAPPEVHPPGLDGLRVTKTMNEREMIRCSCTLKSALEKKITNHSYKITNQSVTSTADNSRHKKGQVAVVQLQRVEARRKLELRLHHVTKRTAEAFEEFTGNEASATGHQEAVFVHAGGQQGEEGFVNTVLQQGHLNVRKEESRKSRSNCMRMKNLLTCEDRKARGRCSFPRPT